MNIGMTRREFAALAGVAMLSAPTAAQTGELITRATPGSGEQLPAVGLGTAYVFDRDDEATRQKAAAVVEALVAGGGSLIATSSVYGDAEAVLGAVIASGQLREKLFIATKLELPDAAELKRSQTRLKTEKFDLLQLHNVRDPQQSLEQFRSWKEQGACRYIGITSPRHADFRCCGAKNLISYRSTIPSMTARPKSASCHSLPR